MGQRVQRAILLHKQVNRTDTKNGERFDTDGLKNGQKKTSSAFALEVFVGFCVLVLKHNGVDSAALPGVRDALVRGMGA